MKRLLYIIALILAVFTAVAYTIGKDWEEDKITLTKELTEAERLLFLKQKASQGDIEALYQLGLYYELDQTDYFEAQKWYRAAASRGTHSGAQYKLGRLYLNGRGVENDLSEAMNWFRKSAEQGDPRGYFFLGIAARDGWERKADPLMAYKWIWLSKTAHDILIAENTRYDTVRILEEMEAEMSQFSIEKARRLAAEYPLIKIQ